MSPLLSMASEDKKTSFELVLERAGELPVGGPLLEFVDDLASKRLASSIGRSTNAYVVFAEALGYWRLKRHKEAQALLLSIEVDLLREPRYWILRGMVAKSLPDGIKEALAAYRQALSLDFHRSDLHYNLANLLQKSDPKAAEQAYLRSLSLDPNYAECWHNLGTLLHEQDRFSEAKICLQMSLQLDPAVANVWCNLGNTLQAQDYIYSAQRAFSYAISLDKSHGASHVNMGASLIQGLLPEEAIDYLNKGVQLEKNSADSLWNLSLAHLQIGDYLNGWSLYDARLSTADARPDEVPTLGKIPASIDNCPRIGDPELIVWSEQGLGDAIQFGRYLPLLESAGIPYEFRCRRPLFSLFKDWFGLDDRVVLETRVKDSSDHRPHIPLMSLPRLFNTQLSTIPNHLPYLKAPNSPPSNLEVPKAPGGLSVGLVWASHANNPKMYRRKSIDLSLLMPRLMDLLNLDLIDFHSLQLGPDEKQLAPWIDHPRITNWAPLLEDFSDTAHVLNQLDLVISVDTAVAHLAGALCRPTWLLLPHAADFRWLLDRVDSPWYPGTMRLFRQPSLGDWQGMVEQLNASLDSLFLLDLGALANRKLH